MLLLYLFFVSLCYKELEKRYKRKERGLPMTNEQMQREMMYSISKYLIGKMKKDGLITEEEYREIDDLNLERFLPQLAEVYR